ncbi:hydrolase [Chloroflexota bacterium]
MEKLNDQVETGCCPRFNPEPWQEKEVTFKDKLFLKDSVRSILHIPINFGSVMVKNMEKINKANAVSSEPLLLSDEKSMWKSDLYIAVDKDVPDAEMVKLSGTFLTKVFEGSYSNTSKWVRAMNDYIKARGKEAKKLYFYYTTCPKCAKVYGKNYTVVLAQV